MPAHANDNAHTTPPIITRLRRAGRKVDLANLLSFEAPPQADLHADNDNRLVSDLAVDCVYRVRPTEGELKRALLKQDQYGVGLRFNKRGQITHYRRADAGGNPVLNQNGREVWLPAREQYEQPKGKRRKIHAEQAEESAAYLAIPATGAFTPASSYVERGSDGEDYRRQRAAAWVQAIGCYSDHRRTEIDRMGVGGRHTFAEAWDNARLPPASRLPQYQVGIARGVSWLAGKTRRNTGATPGSFVGAPDAAENALVAVMDAPKLEQSLGDHAAVLNDALAGMTARKIAGARGWGSSKSAEQRAVRAQDRALAALAVAGRKAA